jgi:hypothetical protein
MLMTSHAKLAVGLPAFLAVLSLGILFQSRLALAQSGQGTPPAESEQVWTRDYNDPLVLTEEETEDSYAIYSMLLKEELKDWHLKRYAIQEWSGDMRARPSDPLCLQPAKEQRATYQDLFQDFLRKNRSRHQLAYRFSLDDYLLLTPGESKHVAGLFSGSPISRWNDDDRKLYHDVNVIFTVSAVGFERDHSHALVYIGHFCGPLCGEGSYHLLVKRGGKWQNDLDYKGTGCQWVS